MFKPSVTRVATAAVDSMHSVSAHKDEVEQSNKTVFSSTGQTKSLPYVGKYQKHWAK